MWIRKRDDDSALAWHAANPLQSVETLLVWRVTSTLPDGTPCAYVEQRWCLKDIVCDLTVEFPGPFSRKAL